MKINPAGAELLHADSRTNSYDEANSRLSHFCKDAQENDE